MTGESNWEKILHINSKVSAASSKFDPQNKNKTEKWYMPVQKLPSHINIFKKFLQYKSYYAISPHRRVSPNT